MAAVVCFDGSEPVGDLLADPGWLLARSSDFGGDAVASRSVLGDCDFGVSREATRGDESDFIASPFVFADADSSKGFASLAATRGGDLPGVGSDEAEGGLLSAVVWALGAVGSLGRVACDPCAVCCALGVWLDVPAAVLCCV